MAGTGRKSGDDVLVVRRAAGDTIAEAAAASGMSERTAYRRLESAILQARVCEARRQLVGEASGKLSRHAAAAAARLVGLVQSDSEQIALGAVRVTLEYLVKVREHDDLARDVAELKGQVVELKARA